MLSLEVFLLTYCFIALIKIMCDRREAFSWRLTSGNAITDDCWSDFYVIKFTHCCQNSLFCKLVVREWNWILRKLKTAFKNLWFLLEQHTFLYPIICFWINDRVVLVWRDPELHHLDLIHPIIHWPDENVYLGYL